MWENETVVLATSLKKRILGGKDKVRFERIESDTAIPGFIKRLFRDRVELYMVKESPLSLKSTPHFDLDVTELNSIKDHSSAVLIGAASFYEKEIESLLQEALILRVEYLVKPIESLKNLIFQENSSLAIAKIEDVSEPFKKTLPYGEILLRMCREQGITSLEKSQFISLSGDIVAELMAGDSVEWIVREFTVLTDYLSESKGEDVSHLDGQIIKTFLADRQQLGFERALDVEIRLGKHHFNSAETQVTLRRYQELKDEFGSNPDIKNTLPSDIQAPGETESLSMHVPATPVEPEETGKDDSGPDIDTDWEITDISDIIPTMQDNAEPEIKAETASEMKIDFEPETTLEAEPVPEVEVVTEALSPNVETTTVEKEPMQAAPKSMRIIRRDQDDDLQPNDTVNETETRSSREHVLRPMIDNKMEKSFIKKLFSGDRDAYNSLMDKLEDAESWRVAKILIDNELFKRDVDPFSREAIKLVDLVYGRYYPEENAGGQ